MKIVLLAVSLTSLVAAGCDQKACTLAGCAEGVDVAFDYREAGTYAVDVTVDGTKTTCTATLPSQANEGTDDACTAAGIFLTRSGSALAPSEQSIGGLEIRSTTARSITVRVTRDGTQLRESTFSPSYVVTPGPNGPDCDPKECRRASFTLP